MTISMQQFFDLQAKVKKGSSSKFRAILCESNTGIKFPSKLERDCYHDLQLKKSSGEINFFLRQPSFDLPGGVRYRADFLVFFQDGSHEFWDCKGMDTPISILKRKQVKELYGVDILIKKRD